MKIQLISILLLSSILFEACGEKKAEAEKTAEPSKPHYELATAEKSGVAQYISLPAQLAAYQEVFIFPKINGYVKSVSVDIGSKVKKGQLLMELEAPELVQAVIQAKEKYERTNSDYAISKDNYERLNRANRTSGAIAPLSLSTAKSKMLSDSSLCNAEKANWQMQQALLSYLKVIAPFDGVITERNIHPGALVSPTDKAAKPMIELKQEDKLRLQADIPEKIAMNLDINDTVSYYLTALPGKKMTASIARKSANINAQYRTERIELDVNNKTGKLSPGMYANVFLYSKADTGALTVPRSAVITSTERKYVIAVRDGKTYIVDVSTGNETVDKVEVSGLLQPGEKIIAKPNEEIKQGITVN
ncbi:MAG: efflux RND transporter periplasmic adaptor subunit [Chitinophagaceae bacterium]